MRPSSGSVIAWVPNAIDRRLVAALAAAAGCALAIALLPLTWLLVLVGGGAILVATLAHPGLGLLLLVPAVPFGSLRQVPLGVMNVGLSDLLVALMLSGWLMRGIARRTVRLALPRLGLLVMVFLGTLSLSLFGAESLQHSAKEILKWVEVLIVFLLASEVLNQRWLRLLLVAILGTGVAAALHGIYQFLFQVGPEGFVLFERFMRAHGTFAQPNPYGAYLGMSLPLGVGLLALGIGRAKDTGRWKWILAGGGAAGIMVVALIMSWSRGAWLGFAAALAAMAVAVVVRSGRAAVVGAVLAILIAYLLLVGGLARLPAPIVQRFNDFAPYLGVLDVEGKEIDDANFAVLERVAHWQAAWSMWTEHPWFGVGVGNYEVEYSRYALPLWPHPLGHAHNYYLNLAAEAGVTGLSAFLLLWGAVLMTAWRATRTTSGWHWCVALGVLGVVVHATVHSFFDNLFVHGMYLHLAIVLGLLEASGATEEGQNP